MRGLTKNSKNFQTLLRQERYHVVSDTLGYWHLTPEFWSGHIMLLTWAIMPYSKSDSSPSFGLCTKNSLVGRWQRWLVKFELKSVNKLHLLSGLPCERYRDSELLQSSALVLWYCGTVVLTSLAFWVLSLLTSILALNSSLNRNKLLTTSFTHLLITRWHTRFVSPLDFGSERNTQKRQTKKLDMANSRGTTLNVARTHVPTYH